MTQSNYKEELIAILQSAGIPDERTSSSGAISHPLIEVLASIDRLNEAVVGKDETLDDCPIENHLCPKIDRNKLRSELRLAFGINKEEEKS